MRPPEEKMVEILKRIADALQQGDEQQVAKLTAEALGAGLPAGDVLQQGLVAGMNVVGEQFRLREIFLPDVLLSARAMYAGLDLLKPHLASEGVPSRGKVVLGTVKGDLHDIGKNLVAIMLKGAGFEVIDLGHDVAPEAFVDAAVRDDPHARRGGAPAGARARGEGAHDRRRGAGERRVRARDRGGRLRLRRGHRGRPGPGARGGVTWKGCGRG
jgi:cobalamin-dependent methionine synthase I